MRDRKGNGPVSCVSAREGGGERGGGGWGEKARTKEKVCVAAACNTESSPLVVCRCGEVATTETLREDRSRNWSAVGGRVRMERRGKPGGRGERGGAERGRALHETLTTFFFSFSQPIYKYLSVRGNVGHSSYSLPHPPLAPHRTRGVLYVLYFTRGRFA